MSIYTLPQSLYAMHGVKRLLASKNNCILYKRLQDDIIDAEGIMVSHVIVYVLNGRVQINTLDGEETIISNGQMLFMPRDSYVISDYTKNNKDLEVFLIFFDHHIALDFLSKHKSVSGVGKRQVEVLHVNDNIISFLETVQRMQISKMQDEMLRLKILEFLYLVFQSNQENFICALERSEFHKQKKDISELMQTHIDKKMTVADFAALSGRSISTFTRVFKEQFQMTPRQWLIEAKMKRAYALLEEGVSVTNVAYTVGYNNVSHFIKAYKKIYKNTPKNMQKSL